MTSGYLIGPRLLARCLGSSNMRAARMRGAETLEPFPSCGYLSNSGGDGVQCRCGACPRRPTTESMRDLFDIYTIIFLALAVFIFLRLRSVLGQRTGRERPPYDPYSARDAVRSPAADKKVVALPQRGSEAAPRPAEVPAPAAERWKDVAETGSAVAAGLDAIAAADSSFDAKHFITGARAAYEMIVTAFASGDRRQLRSLLSREVYDGFDASSSPSCLRLPARHSRKLADRCYFPIRNMSQSSGASSMAGAATIMPPLLLLSLAAAERWGTGVGRRRGICHRFRPR